MFTFRSAFHLVAAVCLLPAGVFAQANKPGRKVTAIPLLNFSSDDGTGYGLRVSLFDYDGTSVPYRTNITLQAFFSTKGKWAHRVYTDLPNLRNGNRVEIEALYEKEDYANYYSGLSDGVLDGYTRDQKTFEQNYPKARVTWIRSLRGAWAVRTGLQAGHISITTNQQNGNLLFDANPRGARGGTSVQPSVALRYDTRDDYNNSTSGLLEELLVEYGLGDDFNGGKFTYEHRHFPPITDGWVFANRINVGLTFGHVPFYETYTLGGSDTLRGTPAARWRGDGRILLNAELRWRGLSLSRSRDMHLGVLLFGDTGQVFSRADGPSMDAWQSGGGAGLRFHWYSTIVRADYGYSGGKTGIYITFSQVF